MTDWNRFMGSRPRLLRGRIEGLFRRKSTVSGKEGEQTQEGATTEYVTAIVNSST